MDGVGTPIIGRPRPLPGHDTPNPANNTYTLNYEEPVNLRPNVEQELSVTRHHIHQLTNVRSSTQALMIPLGTIIPERQAYTSK